MLLLLLIMFNITFISAQTRRENLLNYTKETINENGGEVKLPKEVNLILDVDKNINISVTPDWDNIYFENIENNLLSLKSH